MREKWQRVAVHGLGLLGASLAWGVRLRGLAQHVAGYDRDGAQGALALRRGMLDSIGATPGEAATGAELVILATPVAQMPAVAAEVAQTLGRGTLLSDVGSVKGPLVAALPALLPAGVHYLGSHPMAGGHRSGARHADPHLFDNQRVVLTPTQTTPPAAVASLRAFWEALGARVAEREPDVHDAEVAWISHLPHAVAFAFSRALQHAPERAGELAGPGFRDFSRIAHSEPGLWSDILTANAAALAEPLERTAAELAELAQALRAADADRLRRLLSEARETLVQVSQRASWRENTTAAGRTEKAATGALQLEERENEHG